MYLSKNPSKPHLLIRQRLVLTLSLLVFVALSNSACSTSGKHDSETTIEPFSSDGCSSFPDGTLSKPDAWQHCCYDHDKSYWPGGTRIQRLSADRELASCVALAGYPLTSKLMYAGVRVGGTPYLPTPFRWGFGWPWLRGYD